MIITLNVNRLFCLLHQYCDIISETCLVSNYHGHLACKPYMEYVHGKLRMIIHV